MPSILLGIVHIARNILLEMNSSYFHNNNKIKSWPI